MLKFINPMGSFYTARKLDNRRLGPRNSKNRSPVWFQSCLQLAESVIRFKRRNKSLPAGSFNNYLIGRYGPI